MLAGCVQEQSREHYQVQLDQCLDDVSTPGVVGLCEGKREEDQQTSKQQSKLCVYMCVCRSRV